MAKSAPDALQPIDLEHRLSGIHTPTNELFERLTHLPSPGRAPGNKNQKPDYINNVIRICKDRGVLLEPDFYRAMDSFNKEPLKAIHYGATRSREIPQDVLAALTTSEKVYFLAGLNGTPQLDIMMDARQLVATVLIEGIANVCQRHNAFKTQPTTYHHREYETLPHTPHAKEIRAACNDIIASEPRDLLNQMDLDDLLALGNPNDDEMERTGMMLDSCPDERLIAFTRKYGADRLGGYARTV